MITLNLSKARQQLILDCAILRTELQRSIIAARGTHITLKELDLERIIKHLKGEVGGTTNNSLRRDVEELIAVLEQVSG